MTPLEYFLRWERQQPDRIFLRQPIGRRWVTWTWAQAGDECRRVAAAIRAGNLEPGDHVAILSKNCAHWIMADIAIMMAGCVSVPLYPTLTSGTIRTILEHSDAKAIFVGKLDDYPDQEQGIPLSLVRIAFSMYGISAENSWERILETHEPIARPHDWQCDQTLTIVYTSGTTGRPKGVMHTACTFAKVFEKVAPILDAPRQPSMFSYLPLSHVAERMAVEMNILFTGGTASFSETLQTFAEDLASVQPHAFFAVPRIWSKFQETILKKFPQQRLDTLLSIPLLSHLLRMAIKRKLGLSRARVILSAAAPIAPDLLCWYQRLGIQILQAYGMSEDSVYAHFNTAEANRIGSVGKPLPGLEVKITDEGEICVRSPGNFTGYYKEPALTQEAFDTDGFLRTGDKGQYDAEGYLFITGRIKDQFKTDKGKYISPGPIELKLMASPDIEQVCVVGMGIPQPIALVNLSEAAKAGDKDRLIQRLSQMLATINTTLDSYERVQKIVVTQHDWSIANGMMTPTLKIRRNEVEALHTAMYPTWFNRISTVIWEGP
ncbi:MAG: AMP-binding protein [Bacteroidetes bacterium]|nr:AMP-binding protein [Bacteroidota bacterium]